MSALLDLEAIRAKHSLAAIAAASVELKAAHGELKGCCPFHADRSPSFTIYDRGRRFKCFGCGASGDVIDFVQRLRGVSFREAASLLEGGTMPSAPAKTSPRRELSNDRDTFAQAKRIWREAKPISGTPAARYLERRGIWMKLPPTLRYARLKHPQGGFHPCLVAAVISPERTLSGVQRAFLTNDGRKADLDPAKMSLGRVSGSAIRLAPVASELIVCEGLEDGLTLQQELGKAVWVAAGRIDAPAMQFPGRVRSAVIAADNDEAGERSAQAAAEAFTRVELEVRIIRPGPGFKDWNDQLRGVRS